MASVLLSSITGGGGGINLAPELTFPLKSRAGTSSSASNVDTSVGLTQMLSLTGRFSVSFLELSQLTASDATTVKLTVDGVVVWNDTNSSGGTTMILLGGEISSASFAYTSSVESIIVNSSLLLEVETVTNTNTTLAYNVRPIL